MYLDSSIIVKLLVQEPDSALFQDALIGQALETSDLSLTEVMSALLTKERQGLLSRVQGQMATALFDEKLAAGEIALLPLEGPTYLRARRFLEVCHPSAPLRSLDAIHLAACDEHQAFPLCTNDSRLRAAADRLGIPVFPETLS